MPAHLHSWARLFGRSPLQMLAAAAAVAHSLHMQASLLVRQSLRQVQRLAAKAACQPHSSNLQHSSLPWALQPMAARVLLPLLLLHGGHRQTWKTTLHRNRPWTSSRAAHHAASTRRLRRCSMASATALGHLCLACSRLQRQVAASRTAPVVGQAQRRMTTQMLRRLGMCGGSSSGDGLRSRKQKGSRATQRSARRHSMGGCWTA